MNTHHPNDRQEAAREVARAILRDARANRRDQARFAQLMYGTYDWEPSRIAEALDATVDLVNRLLTADGTIRCIECAFGLHDACLRELTLDAYARPVPCKCDHP